MAHDGRIVAVRFSFDKRAQLDVQIGRVLREYRQRCLLVWNHLRLNPTTAGELVKVLAGFRAVVHVVEYLRCSANTAGRHANGIRISQLAAAASDDNLIA